jgi:hypothetical protein
MGGNMTPQERKAYELKIAEVWNKKVSDFLVGKTIKSVRYMNNEEMDDFMWYRKPVIIDFTDGSWIIPQSDDEGNNGGALYTSNKKLGVIPAI